MGLFKKRFSKNVTRDNEFLKNYAIKCNGLTFYLENNEKVLKELNLTNLQLNKTNFIWFLFGQNQTVQQVMVQHY